MKYSYLYEYDPPIPVLPIRLISSGSGLSTETLTAIVDTGADGTLIPLKYLRKIQATVAGIRQIRSQWGEARAVTLYIVDIEIEGRTLPGIWVAGDSQSDEIILGRSVLNKMRLLLDGLDATSEVLYL